MYFFIVQFTLVREDERPRVAVSQSYIEVTENQPIEVTCAATGVPTPDLTIVRLDGQPLNPVRLDLTLPYPVLTFRSFFSTQTGSSELVEPNFQTVATINA